MGLGGRERGPSVPGYPHLDIAETPGHTAQGEGPLGAPASHKAPPRHAQPRAHRHSPPRQTGGDDSFPTGPCLRGVPAGSSQGLTKADVYRARTAAHWAPCRALQGVSLCHPPAHPRSRGPARSPGSRASDKHPGQMLYLLAGDGERRRAGREWGWEERAASRQGVMKR